MARATDEPIDELEAVIFLDVDGVLHALKPNGVCRDADPDELIARFDAELYLADDAVASVVPGEFNSQCMRLLAQCVSSSGASIVLSSTWRETAPQRRAVDAQLVSHGMRASVSCTPKMPLIGGGRAAEIQWWVEEHRPKRWVALDDMDLSGLPDAHFVRTDPAKALDEETARRVVAALRLKGGGEESGEEGGEDRGRAED